jgi:hypothetical protein
VQSLLHTAPQDFEVTAAAVYLAVYLLYDNKIEEAQELFSVGQHYIKDQLLTFQNQSFSSWIKGGMLLLIYFVAGVHLLEGSRDYIRLAKVLMYTSCVRQLELSTFVSLESVTKRTAFDLRSILNSSMKDLLTGSNDITVTLPILDDLMHQYEKIMDTREALLLSATHSRKEHLLFFWHSCRIYIMKQDGSSLANMRKSADSIAHSIKSPYFASCLPVLADSLYMSMEVHKQCISEKLGAKTAVVLLKEETKALKVLSKKYPIVKARYEDYITGVEEFIVEYIS